MNQTALDELCEKLFQPPLDRLPPVVKPDWGAVCLLASIVLAGIGVVVVVWRSINR